MIFSMGIAVRRQEAGRGGGKAKKAAPPLRGKRRWLRLLGYAAVFSFAVLGGLWIAVQRDPTLGPKLADGARALVGPKPVAWAEDVAYTIQDGFDRVRYRNAKPKTYWSDDESGANAPPSTHADASADGAANMGPADFPPPSFDAPFAETKAHGDGLWIPIADDVAPGDFPVLAKALVHPDPKRSYTVVAVVAMDVRRVRVRAVAGTDEPASTAVPRSQRPGRVPQAEQGALVAAFNGGWQAVHGHWGMMVDGATLLPAKAGCCTLALYKDGTVRIRTWTALSSTEPAMEAYRQTPPCLYEQDKANPGLTDGNRNWGAAVDGQTIIRRSAVGIDKSGNVLFYAEGDGLTALSMARALHAAGAADIAELDVNWAFPRYLFYKHKDSGKVEVDKVLIPGTPFKADEYVGRAWYRDFFYVTRRPASEQKDAGR